MMPPKPFSERMGDVARRILSCFDREDEEPVRPALQISGPTNFRREDVSIPGLDEQQQQFIRDKAVSDARKMWAHLQPLRSSPSGQFASPNSPSPIRVSYEEFTIPRPAPRPENAHRRTISSGHRLAEGLRMHGRKFSAGFHNVKGGSLSGGPGYQPVGQEGEGPKGVVREDSKHEMHVGLMDGQTAGKMSVESDSVGGSEFGREMGGKI